MAVKEYWIPASVAMMEKRLFRIIIVNLFYLYLSGLCG